MNCSRCGKPCHAAGGKVTFHDLKAEFHLCIEDTTQVINFVNGQSGAIKTRSMSTRQHARLMKALRDALDTLNEVGYQYGKEDSA